MSEGKKTFKIFKENGELDAEVRDGIYSVNAEIIIKDGAISAINNGIWREKEARKQ